MIVGTPGATIAGLKSEFFSRLESTETHWQDLATRIASDRKKETYGFLGSVPPVREWGTGRVARGIFAETYDVEDEKYECTLEVDRDTYDDEETSQLKIRIQELAARAALHKDAEISRLLANGDQAGFLSYDGSIFFSATHESGKSGTQDNTLAPIATDPDNPTSTEFRTALGQAIARLLSLVDDQGEPMNMAASGLVCVVPPTMYMTALEAMNATVIGSTTNTLQGAAKIIAFPRLTDASKFFVLKTNVPVRPFIFQDRMPIEFGAIAEKSEEEFLREKYLYGVRARYRMTYGYWQHALQLDFTTT